MIVKTLHKYNIFHGNINLESFIYQAETNTVKLGKFIIGDRYS